MGRTWLITVKAGATLDVVRERLTRPGVDLASRGDPVPLGKGEAVLEVEGPADLDKVLTLDRTVRAIHPSSEFSLY